MIRLETRACQILRDDRTAALRRSLLDHTGRTHEYEALREEAETMNHAEALVALARKHPAAIDEFERCCEREGIGKNRIVRDTIAKARRWLRASNSHPRAMTHADSAPPFSTDGGGALPHSDIRSFA